MERTRHRWKVDLLSDRGEVSTVEYASYWDPEREDTQLTVGLAAAAEASVFRGRGQVKYHATKVERIAA